MPAKFKDEGHCSHSLPHPSTLDVGGQSYSSPLVRHAQRNAIEQMAAQVRFAPLGTRT